MARSRPNWLRALGNAGTPASMAAASRYLDAEDAAVREAACAALRKVADPAAVSALAERCANDDSPAVRRQAVESLAEHHEPAAMAALRSSATSDSDPNVRCAAIHALARDRQDAATRAVLGQVADSDAVPQLREMARQILRGQ